MGKYFKEDNNQRVSKASLDVEALAEKAIRTAGPVKIPPFMKQMGTGAWQIAGKVWHLTDPLLKKLLRQTKVEDATQILENELGGAIPNLGIFKSIKPGTAPTAYGRGTFMPYAKGVSKVLNFIPGWGSAAANIINRLEIITGFEQYGGIIPKTLAKKYTFDNVTDPNKPQKITRNLRQILEALNSEGQVIMGDLKLEFPLTVAAEILKDMQTLDKQAVKWAKIKALAASLGIGIPAAIIQYESRTNPDNVRRRKESEEAGKKAGQKAPSNIKSEEQFKADAERAKRDLGL